MTYVTLDIDKTKSGVTPFEPPGTKSSENGIVRPVAAQKVIYCSPPKCGTTNWQRGMQVLFDIEKQKDLPPDERKKPEPEDYVPLQLFNQPSHWPLYYKLQLQRYPDLKSDFKKIWAGRNPFARVFSAWHDKSR